MQGAWLCIVIAETSQHAIKQLVGALGSLLCVSVLQTRRCLGDSVSGELGCTKSNPYSLHLFKIHPVSFFFFFFFGFFFWLFVVSRAASAAYGDSQARGLIGAAAASFH